MKTAGKFAIILILCLAFVAAVSEAKPRKLPVSAYIKSAKIELISGDLERYPKAVAMLDSLAQWYGPHAEALHWVTQIYVDYIDKTAGPWEKKEYVRLLGSYIDSLHMCCENEEIKDDYRDDCDEYMTKGDSTRVKYWRQFYVDGAEQLDAVSEGVKELESLTDSTARAFLQKRIDAKSDSCRANMDLAMILDSTDFRIYVALGSLYEYNGDMEESTQWLIRGLDLTPNRSDLLVPIAYNYINMDDYCAAIPYLKEHVDASATGFDAGEDSTIDLTSMYNLTVCYNNCGKYDSSMVYYQKILEYDPGNTSVLSSIGRYFNQLARNAADSGRTYRESDQSDLAIEWQKKVSEYFDSSSVYFKKVFEEKPDDAFAAEEYGIISYLREDWDAAILAFERLTSIDSTSRDHWVTLGDVYLTKKNFAKSAEAYEHAAKLKGDAKVYEQLVDLYKELGDTQKMKEYQAKLQELAG